MVFFPLGLTDHSGVVLPPPPTKAIKSIVCDPVGVEKVNRFPPGRLCHPGQRAGFLFLRLNRSVPGQCLPHYLRFLHSVSRQANSVPDVCKSWWFSFSLLQEASRRRKSIVQSGCGNYRSKHCFSVLFLPQSITNITGSPKSRARDQVTVVFASTIRWIL